MCLSGKQGVYFVICPKQGPKMKDVVLNRVGILGPFFCPKQGQGFKPSAAAVYPNMGQVPLTPPPGHKHIGVSASGGTGEPLCEVFPNGAGHLDSFDLKASCLISSVRLLFFP